MINKIFIILFILSINSYFNAVNGSDLPSSIYLPSGKTVENVYQWEKYGRKEWITIFEKEMYGKLPDANWDIDYDLIEEDTMALDGKAIRKQIKATFKIGQKAKSVDYLIFIPKDMIKATFVYMNFRGNFTVCFDKEVPAFKWYLGTEWEKLEKGSTESYRGLRTYRLPVDYIISHGYAVITANYNQFYLDSFPDRQKGYKNSVCEMLFKTENQIPINERGQAIATWAWGYSRMMDYIETDNDISIKKAIVVGHSRLGKTALWAGVLDKRFELVISSCSGSLGAAITREKTGETLERTITYRPHWFARNLNKYIPNYNNLPFDQHILLSLIAPRALYVSSASEDTGAAPYFEYKSIRNVKDVYGNIYGFNASFPEEIEINKPIFKERIGYHIRAGKHEILFFDWKNYIKYADYIFNK
ncbi:MAG: hypothetical protein ROM03_09675 [Mucispirillum sp.]|nr:hypothetical protein [Mucispirillum sp.]